jgi:peptidylprolyl isomerase
MNSKFRRFTPLFAAALILVVIACRGGTGVGGQVDVPVFTPTVSPQICLDDEYPAGAPLFGSDLSFDYTTTATGLHYFDHEVGTGDSPEDGKGVSLHYTGFLTDGCIFDTSQIRGQATLFGLNQLVDGMEEGVSGMLVGGKRRIKIPPSLGYEAAGIPGRIPPNATIIFEVELVEVVAPAGSESTATTTADDILASGVCLNDEYPTDAPQFGSDASFAYTTTDTGLRIFDHEVGTGATPSQLGGVTVNYTGFLTNGCVFDSSYTRPVPTTFELGGLIAGMKEGIGSMAIGGKRRISIPGDLAYGTSGIPGRIPANATIIFEVELVEVVAP